MAPKFSPATPAASGTYSFDIGQARTGGSAGAITLVLQAVLLPLALCSGDSVVDLYGGTHVPGGPSFDYVRAVWLPTLARVGVQASIELDAWGWLPVGRGHARVAIQGLGDGSAKLAPYEAEDRGPLLRITGRAVAADLPPHIAQRMAAHATALLSPLGVPVDIEPRVVQAACPGAGIFMASQYEHATCGFAALGARGKASETVAAEAVAGMLAHHASGAALERHLGDQMLLPLCLAAGRSRFTVHELSSHLETNAWVIEQFGVARIDRERLPSGIARVVVTPADVEPQSVR